MILTAVHVILRTPDLTPASSFSRSHEQIPSSEHPAIRALLTGPVQRSVLFFWKPFQRTRLLNNKRKWKERAAAIRNDRNSRIRGGGVQNVWVLNILGYIGSLCLRPGTLWSESRTCAYTLIDPGTQTATHKQLLPKQLVLGKGSSSWKNGCLRSKFS